MPDKATPAFSARAAALALLELLHRRPDRDVPLPVLLNEQSGRFGLDARDTALTLELVCGVLRTQKRLWALLKPFLRKPDSLPPPLRFLLLAAFYELFFLDQIPARATVHQAAGMARRRFGPAMGGLANAVLRNLDRHLAELREQDAAWLALPPERAEARDIERLGSLPAWLAEQWLHDYGPATAWNFAREASRQPVPGCRVNAVRPDAPGVREALLAHGGVPLGRTGIVFPGSPEGPLPHEETLPAFLNRQEQAGALTRQGAGSILLAERLADVIHADAAWRDAPLWDACCGRGGKTCALLEQGVHVELASDPSERRLADMEAALRRLGLPAPASRRATLQETAAGLKPFPLILLDAPCSGSGTLARNPELRCRLQAQRAETVRALQKELLARAWQALAPGGLLAYATCALSKAENEEQIGHVLATSPQAVLMEQSLFAPVVPGQDVLFLALLRKA